MPIIDPDQGASLPSLADLANNQSAFSNFYANVLSRNNLRYTDAANRTALHPANTEGEESYLTTPNRKDVNTGAAWVSLEQVSAYFSTRLTADFLFTLSSIVPQSVTGFSVTLAEVGTYTFSGVLFYDSSGTADLRAQWLAPANTFFRWGIMGIGLTPAAIEGDVRIPTSAAPGTAVALGGAGVGTVLMAPYWGSITTSAAGTLTFQGAQQVVDPTQTTLRIGSTMRVVRTS